MSNNQNSVTTSSQKHVADIWRRGKSATAQHLYCQSKKVGDGSALAGLRVLPDDYVQELAGLKLTSALVVPLTRPDGTLQAVHCITPDGQERTRGSMEDAFFVVGTLTPDQPAYICEGLSAAWACHSETGHAAVVAFKPKRMGTVTAAVRVACPTASIVLVPNAGQEDDTEEVAIEHDCALAKLPNDLPNNTDAWVVWESGMEPGATTTLSQVLAAAVKPTRIKSRIPDDNSRPKFVVFDDMYVEGTEHFKPGVWWFGTKTVGKGSNMVTVPINIWVCTPLHVDAVTIGEDDDDYGRLLRFKSIAGKWKTLAVSSDLVRSEDCSDLRGILLKRGMVLNTRKSCREHLSSYIEENHPALQLQCATQTGWSDNTYRAFVLPDKIIGPKAAEIVYQTEGYSHNEYNTGGSLEGWKKGIAAIAVGNPMLVLALCTAFSGPVLAMCHAENGGPHFVGNSSTGKTSLLEAACSIWGSPDVYKRSWRATSNGLESAAALFNDSMLALDEISECDPKAVGEVVYMLGNGRGKQRANRKGGVRPVARWRCAVISTGERGVGSAMAEAGQTIKAGQEVRLFEVPCERTHGAWDTLHHHATGFAFSNALKDEAADNYGHAGRAFLECLAKEDSNLDDLLNTIRENHVFQTAGEGQEQRVAGRFAILALAGELATAYGVTGWPEGEAIRAAEVGFEAWRSQRITNDGANSEAARVIQAVTNFIETYRDSRFSQAKLPLGTSPVRERAGYWLDNEEGRAYFFINKGMEDALKGFDFHRSLNMLKTEGYLVPSEKANSKSMRMERGGDPSKVYEIWLSGAPGSRKGKSK